MNKKIGVWGLGVVGTSAIKYFVAKGFQVQAMDQKEPSAQLLNLLNELRVPFIHQKELGTFLNDNDFILPSCGIDLRPYQEYRHLNFFLNWIYSRLNAKSLLSLSLAQ